MKNFVFYLFIKIPLLLYVITACRSDEPEQGTIVLSIYQNNVWY